MLCFHSLFSRLFKKKAKRRFFLLRLKKYYLVAFLCHKQSEELPFSIFSMRRTCPAFPFVGLAGPKKGMGETCVPQSGDALWAQVGWLFLQLDDSYLWNFMT